MNLPHEDMAKRMDAITEASKEMMEFAAYLCEDMRQEPSVILTGMAVALVELNHDNSGCTPKEKDESFESMVDVLRFLHHEYAKNSKLRAAKEAEIARIKGRIQ